jgi:hypothetical protein
MAFVQQSGSSTEARIPKGKLEAETVSKELVKANADRIGLIVVNEGTNTVWFAKGPTAVAKEGPFLVTNGAWEFSDYSGGVSVITSTGKSNVTYSET